MDTVALGIIPLVRLLPLPILTPPSHPIIEAINFSCSKLFKTNLDKELPTG
jgi:hypothetical protein